MARLRKSVVDKLVGSQNASRASKPLDLVTRTQSAVRSTTKISAAADLKRLSGSGTTVLEGIRFGSPSNTGVKSRSPAGNGNEWTSLIKNASSGVASLIGGGFLESGISSLVSGITSLFDGGDEGSETPLTRFALPDSQQEAMYVVPQGLSTSVNSGGIQQGASQGPVYRQSEIVRAVRNALLTSSSLNDVIAEI
jgi:hypothetical protein